MFFHNSDLNEKVVSEKLWLVWKWRSKTCFFGTATVLPHSNQTHFPLLSTNQYDYSQSALNYASPSHIWPIHCGTESSRISVEENSKCSKSQSTSIWQCGSTDHIPCTLCTGESGDIVRGECLGDLVTKTKLERIRSQPCYEPTGQSVAGNHKSHGALGTALGTFALRPHNYRSQQRYNRSPSLCYTGRFL